MDNLTIYNKVRTVPKEALKEIQAGRLKGKSDINPMWRIKALTEQFGVCGIGWKYTITKQWLEQGGNNEIAAFVNIDLFIKVDGEWSAAIPGTGGSSFVANERNGPYVSDECFKMALTDAISVACKALGFAADIYWNSDSTKYNKPEAPTKAPQPVPAKPTTAKPIDWARFWQSVQKLGFTEAEVHIIAEADSLKDWSREKVDALYNELKTMKSEVKFLGDERQGAK